MWLAEGAKGRRRGSDAGLSPWEMRTEAMVNREIAGSEI